jgi:hypothetical protein
MFIKASFLFATIFALSFNLAIAQAEHALEWKSLFGTAQINGKAVQIDSAQSEKTPREVLDKISALWKTAGFHVISESKNGWELVSRIHRGQLEVVQAKHSATGAYLMRHRVSIETPAQTPMVPDWLSSEGKVLFATQSSDVFQSGSSWLIELKGASEAQQTIQRIAERTKAFGYQQHPNLSIGQQLSAVQTNFGSAAQTVLSAEGGRQVILQVIPNKRSAMLLVTQVLTSKLKEPQ